MITKDNLSIVITYEVNNMDSVCVFNNKGGVGKTTFLCNLASSLSVHHSKKVLIVDADPQCNATTYALSDDIILDIYEKRNKETIYKLIESYIKGKSTVPKDIPIINSPGFCIDIIPGDPKLSLADDFLARDWFDARSGEERGLRSTLFLNDTLYECKKKEYDFVIFDAGPSLGAINRSVLLVSDFFIVPMASDIFSLQALTNIRIALEQWKDDIKDGLSRLSKNENEDLNFSQYKPDEKTKFIGYVTQQYTAKSVEGKRVPVKAYENIIKKIPSKVRTNLTKKFSKKTKGFSAKIGEIPYLQSMVPLSQTANKPIFLLKSKDGVVGSHFAKVKEFDKSIFDLSSRFIENIEVQR